MNKEMDKPQGTGGAGDHPYIWLRYATQFSAGGRTHTIEMGIPVPLGASAEMRAQLIREAETGMHQLTSHIENRVNQVLQRNARPQGTTSAPVTAQASKPASKPPAGAPSSHTTSSQDVALQATQKIPQRPQGPQGPAQDPAQDQGVVVPPTRTYVGSSMPTAPRLSADANGSLTLPQFLHIVKESMNLSSQQAKELLQVPTLNGLNLRDALERLQHIVGQKGSTTASPAQKPQEIGQVSSPQRPTSSPPPAQVPVRPPVVPIAQSRPAPAPIRPVPAPGTPPAASLQERPGVPIPIDLNRRGVNDKRPGYRFDEEEDEEMEILYEGDDDERPGLSAEDRLKARDIISKLRGARGSSLANQARLTVLHNVAGSQISDEQLQQLLQGLWETTTEKKLKVDQVEALISWAKEDDFVSEADAVLALLEEE
jgi:hypothetical protein